MVMDSNGGDAKLTLNFDYHGWQAQIEIPHLSAATLPNRLEGIIAALEKMGCKPAAPAIPVATTAPASPATANDGPPICPYHGKPMKASKKPGSWFCPSKTANGDYCPYTIES